MSVDPAQVLGALMVGTVGWLFRREIAGWLLDAFDGWVSDEGPASSNAPVPGGDTAGGSPSSAPPVSPIRDFPPSSELSFSEALRPIGGPPSWESVRRNGR